MSPDTPNQTPAMFIINEDCSHFYYTREDDAMTLESLQAWVDGYAGTAVTHLILNPNGQRTSYRSGVREAIWDPVDGVAPESDWSRRARLLHERGLDPYKIWIERSHHHGISPWISMRMNDVHLVLDPTCYFHSSFWREHPEFRIVPHATSERWQDYSLDYRHPEVREHQMALVEELLERYGDADGLELDWMRFGFHFPPGKETESIPVLTAFVGEVYQRVQAVAVKRGRPMHLAVRVPAHPDAARGLGMDAIDWADRGWIDLLIPCPFWRSSDFDIPVEQWQEELKQVGCTIPVAPGLEYNAAPFYPAKQVPVDLELCDGFAASAQHRGAHDLYFFNWMDSQTRPVSAVDYRRFLERGFEPDDVRRRHRRHPVCFRDTVPEGFPDGSQLPVAVGAGGHFRIPVGAAPDEGQVRLILALSGEAPAADGWEISVNGVVLTGEPLSVPTASYGGDPQCALAFPVPIEAMQSGDNRATVRNASAGKALQVVWVEFAYQP